MSLNQSLKTSARIAAVALAATHASVHAGWFDRKPKAPAEGCSLVTVEAFRPVGPARFGQRGVGWVMSTIMTNERSGGARVADPTKERYFVFTPAHVVAGANELRATCGARPYRLRLVGSSPTYDLALLSIEDSDSSLRAIYTYPFADGLLTIQSFSNDSRSNRSTGLIVNVRPGEEQSSRHRYILSRIEKTFSENDSPIAPFESRVQTIDSGVRPGMSGSPLYEAVNPKLPVAMLTRTQINSNRAVGIPMHNLYGILVSMMDGFRDPWRAQDPGRPYIEYRFKDFLRPAKPKPEGRTERTRILQVPAKGKSPALSLEEICTEVGFTPTGGDFGSTGGDFGSTGGDFGSTGGDFGSTGGDFGSTGGKLAKGSYLSQDGGPQSIAWGSQFFKVSSPCTHTGLRMPNGHMLIGLKRGDGTLVVDSIEDIFSLLLAGKIDSSTIRKDGVFAQSLKDMSPFCSEKELGPSLAARQAQVAPDGTGLSELDHRNAAIRGLLPPPDRDIVGKHRVSLVPLAPGQSLDGAGVSCNPSKETFTLMLQAKAGMLPFELDARIQAHTYSAKVRIGRCTIDIDSQPRHPTNIFIDRKEARLFIELDGAPLSTRVSLLGVSRRCLDPGMKQPWLFTYEGWIENSQGLGGEGQQ